LEPVTARREVACGCAGGPLSFPLSGEREGLVGVTQCHSSLLSVMRHQQRRCCCQPGHWDSSTMVGDEPEMETPQTATADTQLGDHQLYQHCEIAALPGGGPICHHLSCHSTAHMNLHQEEKRTPQGVHCPEACLIQQSMESHHSSLGTPGPLQQNVAPACLFAIPAMYILGWST